jgi:hypothetical protein
MLRRFASIFPLPFIATVKTGTKLKLATDVVVKNGPPEMTERFQCMIVFDTEEEEEEVEEMGGTETGENKQLPEFEWFRLKMKSCASADYNQRTQKFILL